MNVKVQKPVILVIFDGFGFSSKKEGNAIFAAKMKMLDDLMEKYPWTTVEAAGEAVGLLPGYIGNSEVGHLTIGAGRIIDSPLKRMHQLMSAGFEKNLVFKNFIDQVKQEKKRLHLLGLLSDGGVHSHQEHLHGLIKSAADQGVTDIYLHLWFDGRDVPPQSAKVYLNRLKDSLQKYPVVHIASLAGRFYAMDRDGHDERTDAALEVIRGQGKKISDIDEYLTNSYAQNIDDQYIKPVQVINDGVKEGDALFFFNIRPERMKQIVEALCNLEKNGNQKVLAASSVAYWDQNPSWAPTPLLENQKVENGFLERLSRDALEKKYKIVTIAESEKKVHVGYYLHGNSDALVTSEERIIISSHTVDSYAQDPAMSAHEITQTIIDLISKDPNQMIIVNYANADMVGHSGDFEATVQACKVLDEQLQKLYALIKPLGGTIFLTADHGNAEQMIDEKTKTPLTSHTINPVIFLVISEKLRGFSFKKEHKGLSSLAATILELLGLDDVKELDKRLTLFT